MAIGLYLMSRINAETSTLMESLFMVVLGAGIGLCMQVLTLIVQNTARYEDLGVSTSGVTFFRTLGSSFGAAVFGSLFANFLSTRLPAALLESRVPPRVVATPEALHRLPPHVIAPIVDAYAHSLEKVFLWSVPVAVVGFLLALALKEVPLRGSARAQASDLGEGFGMPTQESPERCLERAIGAVMSSRIRDNIGAIMAASGTQLQSASAWGVVEITRFARARGDAHIQDIARWHRLPTSVLDPTFDRLAAEGMIERSDGILTLTAGGQVEVSHLIAALRDWLREELSDWGPSPDDDEINRALDRIARRMLGDEADTELPALGAASSAA